MRKPLISCCTALALALVAVPARAVVTGTTTEMSYTANGATTAFGFTFKASDKTWVKIFVGGVLQSSGYTVTLNANQDSAPGGKVTFTAAPARGVAVKIRRDVPFTQPTIYKDGERFPAKTTEGALDRAVLLAQQVDRRVAEAEATHAAEKVEQEARDDAQDAALGVGAVGSGDTFVKTEGATTGRPLKKRFMLDPKDFGAACDQTKDDTADLQEAFTAAGPAQKSVVLTGACRFTGPLTIPQGVSVYGYGPTFGSGLISDGPKAQIRLIGSETGSGGWVFRQTLEGFHIKVKPGSTPPSKLVEVVNGYNINFSDILIDDLPDAVTAYDITDSNQVVFTRPVVRGRADLSAQSTARGIVANGSSSLQIISPDVEALNRCFQAWGSSKVSIFGIYTERCIVAVDNQMDASGYILVSGGRVSVPNNSCQGFRQSAPAGVTVNLGVYVSNQSGTNKTYGVAGSIGTTMDPATGRWRLGKAIASGQIDTPPYLLTLMGTASDTMVYAGGAIRGQRLRTTISGDRGDTDVTLVIGTDAQVQRFATVLTANRTVTLPTMNASQGDWYRIVRTGLGPFTINVGGVKTIPASTAAWVEVMFDGVQWVLIGYGVL